MISFAELKRPCIAYLSWWGHFTRVKQGKDTLFPFHSKVPIKCKYLRHQHEFGLYLFSAFNPFFFIVVANPRLTCAFPGLPCWPLWRVFAFHIFSGHRISHLYLPSKKRVKTFFVVNLHQKGRRILCGTGEIGTHLQWYACCLLTTKNHFSSASCLWILFPKKPATKCIAQGNCRCDGLGLFGWDVDKDFDNDDTLQQCDQDRREQNYQKQCQNEVNPNSKLSRVITNQKVSRAIARQSLQKRIPDFPGTAPCLCYHLFHTETVLQ